MVPANGSSKSEQLRKRGNDVYLRLRGPGRFAVPVQRAKLTRAHELYTYALAESNNPDDRASGFKNLGKLSWFWTKFEMDVVVSRGEREDMNELGLCKSRLSMTVEFLLNALQEGARAAKTQEWLANLDAVLAKVVDWASSNIHFPSAPTLRYLCQAFDVSLSNSPVKCEPAVVAHIRFAEKLLQQGILKLGEEEGSDPKDIGASLSLMHDCLQPLQRAGQLPGNRNLKIVHRREIEDLQERAHLQICTCESMQARATGDEILRKAVCENEELNMDLVYESLDFYRKAALLTREKDMESEAIATSRIGRVFSEIFKNGGKAAQFHYQATKLALTVMSPRIARAAWYTYSLQKVGEHQASVVQVEEKKYERRRAPIKKKLTEKLKKIQMEAKKDVESFLRYIYQEHPNPDPKKHPGKMLNFKICKETLKKAMSHYHPDVNGKHGEECEVLCEEISKVLNNKYESQKLS